MLWCYNDIFFSADTFSTRKSAPIIKPCKMVFEENWAQITIYLNNFLDKFNKQNFSAKNH